MDILFSVSIIASFVAGMVALFAPCCVSILLPTYLAAVFREKTKVLKMTFIYFLGMAIILIPIGLGAAFITKFFQDIHIELYILGGLMMVAFGIMSFAGKGMAMLPKSLQPKAGGFSKKSVFMLGVFSGAATSCCAPVLAGALTLAVLSGTFVKAIIVVFAYVFGMTIPLFVIATFWDKFDIQNSRLVRGKLFKFKFGKKIFYIHSTNLIAGIIFSVIGLMLITLALSGNTFWAPSAQVSFGESLTRFSTKIVNALQIIPDYIWGVIIVAIFAFLLRFSFNNFNRNNKKQENENTQH
ncbi:MAG: cytochrome c biogenesis CcdA family protein [Patescibacteria group bacterium]